VEPDACDRVGVADVVQVRDGDQRIPVGRLDAGGDPPGAVGDSWVRAHGFGGEQATLGGDRRPRPTTPRSRPVRTRMLGRSPDQGPWWLSSPDGGRGKQTTHERRTTARCIAARETAGVDACRCRSFRKFSSMTVAGDAIHRHRLVKNRRGVVNGQRPDQTAARQLF